MWIPEHLTHLSYFRGLVHDITLVFFHSGIKGPLTLKNEYSCILDAIFHGIKYILIFLSFNKYQMYAI